jgi:hypothetical protein
MKAAHEIGHVVTMPALGDFSLVDSPGIWIPSAVTSEPGFAMATILDGGLLRIVLVDVARKRLTSGDVRSAVSDQFSGSLTGIADGLVSSRLRRPLCSSVAVADLEPDGHVNLCVRNAPPAVLFTGDQLRMLSGRRVSYAIRTRLRAGEALVLRSAKLSASASDLLYARGRETSTVNTLFREITETLSTTSFQGGMLAVVHAPIPD